MEIFRQSIKWNTWPCDCSLQVFPFHLIFLYKFIRKKVKKRARGLNFVSHKMTNCGNLYFKRGIFHWILGTINLKYNLMQYFIPKKRVINGYNESRPEIIEKWTKFWISDACTTNFEAKITQRRTSSAQYILCLCLNALFYCSPNT